MEFQVNYDHSLLRRVKTVFTLDEINEYAVKGHHVLIEEVKQNPQLYSSSFIFREKATGLFIKAPAREYGTRQGWINLDEDEWEEVCKVRDYARERPANISWAAYILPTDLKVGEVLYIEDIVEDIKVSEFWGAKIYAIDGVAIWNGKNLEFQRELYDESECLIVG